jgi:acyl dehydratase
MAHIRPPGLPVERGKIHEFANAILDDHPHYHDAEAAAAAGLPGVVAPPTFVTASALFADPDVAMPPELAALDMRYALHGGQEFTFERPLVAGDVLRAEAGEVKTYEKQGKRGGTMKFVEVETVYRDAHGEVVVRARSTAIQTSGVVRDAGVVKDRE